ncbi:hypothetical protein [Siphonobacter sp.]|uniref:hypothetical protein n=1 Tax=Siphonobacter sp. TaxID=1869184 RepID=UPI003B3B2E4E
MGVFDNLKNWLRTSIWKDNTTEDITPAKLREGIFAFADQVEQLLAVVRQSNTSKYVTAVTANDRSWPIKLSLPTNAIGDFLITGITKKVFLKDVHFTVSGAGDSRVIQITDQTIDKFEPGEKLYYSELQKGSDLEFSVFQVGMINQGGQNKFAWKMPSEPESAFRPFADVPSGYRTTDILHPDAGFGLLPLSQVLAKTSFKENPITAETDWRTLSDGIYFYAAATWRTDRFAPTEAYGYGFAWVVNRADGCFIQIYPHAIPQGVGGATLVRFPGADWQYSKWQYTYVKAEVNRLNRLMIGVSADSGENVQFDGSIALNGVNVSTRKLTKNIAYKPGDWMTVLTAIEDLEFRATYLVSLSFSTFDQGGRLYFYGGTGQITLTEGTNADTPIPLTFNGYAHATNDVTVEYRWLLGKGVNTARLQIRTVGDDGTASGTLPVQVQLRRLL